MSKKLVLVEAISRHRIRYVVEVTSIEVEDEGLYVTRAAEIARNNIDNLDFEEFSQLYLGTDVVYSSVLPDELFIETFDKDNDYLASWPEVRKREMINSENNF